MDFNVFVKECPSRAAFDTIFSRWGILTLARLTREPTRFGVLRRSIDGISEKMLAETLRVLEEEGLVSRTEWNEKPPRVEYALTADGERIAAGFRNVLDDLYAVLETRIRTNKTA